MDIFTDIWLNFDGKMLNVGTCKYTMDVILLGTVSLKVGEACTEQTEGQGTKYFFEDWR